MEYNFRLQLAGYVESKSLKGAREKIEELLIPNNDDLAGEDVTILHVFDEEFDSEMGPRARGEFPYFRKGFDKPKITMEEKKEED